jgi:LCP family protein required for cell wall assembly
MTIGFIAILIFAGWLTLRIAIKPPVIAQGPEEPLKQEEQFEPAYNNPEADHADTLIGRDLPESGEVTPTERKPEFYTFLVFGLDGGVNTDTIMVAAYDGVKHKAYVIGFPRDGKVNVRKKIKKINAAYPVGTLNGGGKEGGIDQLKRELRTIIGFTPDYSVCIDFNAFVRLVDSVGGVDIDVEKAMDYDDPYQNLHINIPKGLQKLDGTNALKYARYRKGNDEKDTITDYKRIEHQQAVIKAVLKKLLTPASILRIPEFIDIFDKNVYTDLKMTEMIYFADQLKDIPGTDALETYTIPTTGTSGWPSYYELFDEEAIIELVNGTVNPYTKDITAADIDIVE